MNSIMQDYEQEYSTTSAEITTLWNDRITLPCFILNPLKYGIFMILRYMEGGLVCHLVKDDISMIEDNSGYSYAPRHMFRAVASTESSPLSDPTSPWIFRV